jgi:hypothetical protein
MELHSFMVVDACICKVGKGRVSPPESGARGLPSKNAKKMKTRHGN